MYYAGDTFECALWETVLRNLVIAEGQPQYVDEAQLAGRSIVRLELAQETAILDLRAPHLRHLSSDGARHTEWQQLCVVAEASYGQTHSAARELVATAPRAAGISWHSRQIQSRTAYVFYSPPLDSSRFRSCEMISLGQPEGWNLVDKTLQGVGVQWIKAGALVNELLEELPPEEAEAD